MCAMFPQEKHGSGGSSGKGTWDPNYNNNEEDEEEDASYRKKVRIIVEEYFANDDVVSTAQELKELEKPMLSYYFVKKLVSMAMDRHDKEKEMAALLLSALYGDVIDPREVYKGFSKLVESADDLIVDIPETVDVVAVFIARAIVDDILPPSFLTKQMRCLPDKSKGVEVLTRAEKGYLAAPLHAEIIERRWGGSRNKSVEEVKARINTLLIEYVASGDKKEALRCVKDLQVPFYHHEIVKHALIMAMERAEARILDLLKQASEEGVINSSQITKGFGRMIDTAQDLSLDIPNACGILQRLISKAASEGWLCVSALKTMLPEKKVLEESVAKAKAHSIIQEYFLSGDIMEVSRCLEPEMNAIFVKKLITVSMDRKKREKEMASVLLSSLCFPAEDVVKGFAMLIESAEDTALDIPVVVEDLAMFVARAVVDEVLAPQHLEDIGSHKVVHMANSLLKARLSGERILRCWGGSPSTSTPLEDVKDKIAKLLDECHCGGDIREACRCIRELGMPFFHHEVVKKALVAIIENNSHHTALWTLLHDSFRSGLITMNQMVKGFARLADSLDDLALDVPDAENQFLHYVQLAKGSGWLDSSFNFPKSGHALQNGSVCNFAAETT